MRSALLIAAVLLTAASARAEIAWRPNLKAAHDEASQAGKLILVHFYSDNCVWCERLERGTFQDPAVAVALESNFVPVKINGSREPKFASAFGVSRYPTDVIVTVGGDVLAHQISPQEASRYLAMLNGPEVRERIVRGASAAAAPIQTAAAQSPSEAPAATVAGQAYPSADSTLVSAGAAATPGHAVAGSSLGGPVPRQANPQVAGPGPEFGNFAMPPGIAAGNFDMRNFAGTPAIPAGHRSGGNAAALGLAAPTNSAGADSGSKPGQDPAAPASPQVTLNPQARFNPQAAQGARDSQSSGTASTATDTAKPAVGRELPPEAMDGYCPVTMIQETRWAQGKPEYGVIHLGQLYLFASAEAQREFQASPERYTPVLNGIDVVKFFDHRQIVPGSREWGYTDPLHGRMFFFADEASMNHFYDHHERYVESAIELTRRAAADANRRR